MRISDWSSDGCSSDLNCLIYTYRAQRHDWHLVDAAGAETVVTIAGNIETNNSMMLRAAALAGLGVVLLPLWIIGPDLKAGRLQRLLPDYHWPDSAIHIVYPPGRHLSARVRAFVDFLVEQRSEEHTSELQSLMRISYAVFCLKKKTN